MIVFVVFDQGVYEEDLDSIWSTREAAEARCKKLLDRKAGYDPRIQHVELDKEPSS